MICKRCAIEFRPDAAGQVLCWACEERFAKIHESFMLGMNRLLALTVILGTVGVVYVAAHFIIKFW